MRQLLETILPMAAPQFAKYHYLHESADRQAWRVTAFVSALERIDYAQMLAAIRYRLAAQGLGDQPDAGVSVHLTGVMPLVHEVQRALMNDLFLSFLSAFGIIFVVMTIVQAGIATAIVSMIPNFFPMVLMFGLLGWIGTPLDIGTVMTASIALGIAVDDVIHFLTFYNRALARGLSREEAVHATYQQCGFAMFVSSMVCGLGPLVFVLSDFLPTARFAWMMLLLLTVAVLGDLVLLPALVVGPLGKLFERQHARREPTTADELSGRRGRPARSHGGVKKRVPPTRLRHSSIGPPANPATLNPIAGCPRFPPPIRPGRYLLFQGAFTTDDAAARRYLSEEFGSHGHSAQFFFRADGFWDGRLIQWSGAREWPRCALS